MKTKKDQAAFLVGTVSGQELCDGLAERRTPLKTRFIGCSGWLDIPVSLVEEAEILGDGACKDHKHAVVRLTIVASESGAAVAQMLRRIGRPRTARMMPDPHDCYYDPLTEEFICRSPGEGGPEDEPGQGGDKPDGGEDPIDLYGQLLTVDAAASSALSTRMTGPHGDIARDIVTIGMSVTDHRGVPFGGAVEVRTISKPAGAADLAVQSVSAPPKGQGFASVFLEASEGARIARGSYVVGLRVQSGNERGEAVVSFDVGVLRLGLACSGTPTDASVGNANPEAVLLTMCVEDVAAGPSDFDTGSLEVFVIEKPSQAATLETSEAIDVPQLGFYRVFLIASNKDLNKPIVRGAYTLGVKVGRGGAQGFGVVSFVVSD